MTIDDQVKDAIRRASSDLGGQNELAKRAGISPSMITKYLNGGIESIEKKTETKLLPLIRPYLPAPAGITARLLKSTPSFGVSESTPAINLAVMKRVAKLTEDQCWKLCGIIAKLEEEQNSKVAIAREEPGDYEKSCGDSSGDGHVPNGDGAGTSDEIQGEDPQPGPDRKDI